MQDIKYVIKPSMLSCQCKTMMPCLVYHKISKNYELFNSLEMWKEFSGAKGEIDFSSFFDSTFKDKPLCSL